MSASGEAYGEESVAAYTKQPAAKTRHFELSEEAVPNPVNTATAPIDIVVKFDPNDERE